MLNFADKIFLCIVLVLTFPVFVVIPFVLGDFTVFTILCTYTFLAVRLVSSDCFFIKSIGYGFASAPLVLLLEASENGNTLGREIPTREF